MQFYLAPMEGISGYIYRNAVHDFFGDGITKYYTPFIAPRPKKGMASKERRGLLPENNQGIPLVPQILTNKAEDFLTLSEEICDFRIEDYFQYVQLWYYKAKTSYQYYSYLLT